MGEQIDRMLGLAAADKEGLLPGELEIRRYEREGYYVTPQKILSDDIIERALYGVARYYQGERDRYLPISGGYLDWHPEHGGELRINDYVSLQNEELRELRDHGLLAAIAGRLARTSEIRLFHDQLITKLPSVEGATVVGWHVDKAYWRTCTSEKMLTAWIPLVETTEAMGGLAVVPGSHRWDNQDWMATFNEQDLGSLEKRVSSAGVPFNKTTLKVPLGCVSFHHSRTIHGSCANRGSTARIALTIHFQDRDNHYRVQVDRHGRNVLHVNDLLCRCGADGSPDYSDPEICPTLWRAEQRQ